MPDTIPDPEEMQFQFGTPKQEIDEPLDFSGRPSIPDQLTTKKLEIAEKDKDRKEKRYFTAFKLIVGCLIFLGIIYIVEIFTGAIMKEDPSRFTDEIIEIIKTLLFTLSGYLFARKENGE